EEPYFKQVQFEICSHVVSAICFGNRKVTFEGIYRALTDDSILKDLAAKVPKELSAPLVKWLMESKEKRDEKTAGLRAQLSPFAVGELAPLVNGKVEGRPYLSLSEQVTRLNHSSARFLVFSLPTLMYQETAKILGKMILQELGFSVSYREQNDVRNFTSVFLDEFSAFVYPEFVQILNKARSSGVAIHLSHQSIGDLKEISPSFATTINTNTNVKCILGVNDPETADFFAKHMGTSSTAKMTEQILQEEGDIEIKRTGRKSLREVEAYKIHPNDLKHFTHGRGAIHFIEDKIPYTEVIQFEAMQ
ncbi:MAG: TraM recognition domain-containing protein, partial [Bdellovibrionales bacterium]|nr:TraM recognition domain-containing protein [Bdellovibrionales bacterium]